MGLFDLAKNMLRSNLNKFSGNKDFLEAVCAGAALVAYADGSCSDEEVAAALTAVSTSPSLTGAFTSTEIERCMNEMLKRASSGTVGRVALMREIADIRTKPDMAEVVVCTLIDVASASGDIDAKELKVISAVAGELRIDHRQYLP